MSKLINKSVKTKLSKTGIDCILRAVSLEKQGYEIQYGTLWINDKGLHSGLKGFDQAHPFHFWVIDDNDNVYDDYSAIQIAINNNNFDTKQIKDWKIKLVDGSNLDIKHNSIKKMDKIRKEFNKLYKEYDAIYVYNFAYIPSDIPVFQNGMITYPVKKQMTWDDAEIKLQAAELQLGMLDYETIQKLNDNPAINYSVNKNRKFYIKVN